MPDTIDDSAWLKELKPGDDVFMSGNGLTLYKVSRLTKASVWLRIRPDCEEAFCKKNGRRVGDYDQWHPGPVLRPANAEWRARAEVNAMYRQACELQRKIQVPRRRAEILSFIAAVTPFVPTEKTNA
jgi:hypothetical protein